MTFNATASMPAATAPTGPQGFVWPVRVYWEDTDAGGIVFYANYLRFMERARTEWLRSLGLQQQALRESCGGMFVVSHAALDYLRPARLDDLLHVSARVQARGRASLDIAQQVWLVDGSGAAASDDGPATATVPVLLCSAVVRIGWVSDQSLRPQRIPAHLLERLIV